jgi:hypothetical protein
MLRLWAMGLLALSDSLFVLKEKKIVEIDE